MNRPEASAFRIDSDFTVQDFDNLNWHHPRLLTVDLYWSGDKAPVSRWFQTQLLWSDEFLYVRFTCEQHEPIIASEVPDVTRKAEKLWERDVCEIFIAPDSETPEKYFEFEVAPTGEWLDLAIHQKADERITDWNYSSGMEAAAEIADRSVTMAIRIPWAAFGVAPEVGDTWRTNIFRLVGSGDSRGYLAWSPTLTAAPDFHVPDRFGEIEFR